MQISAYKDGKHVTSNIKDFAGNMKQGRETYEMGNSPTEFVYSNPTTGKKRTVNLIEAAQSTGMKNVQFKFNSESMQKQGYMKDKDIDSGVAYNIERIKTARGRASYLKDQGYQNIYQDGDNYFGMENGKMIPINNKDGLDTSDFVRLISNFGRDAGAVIGATAAIGAGAVAAVPSLGTSLGVGVAAAGVAGAAGGVVGEGIQRGVESLFGIAPSKYNEDMTTEEEMSNVGESAFIGGIGGVLQPLMVATGGKLSGYIGRKLSKAGSEFAQTAGAKLEAHELSTRLPQGFLQKYASSEEAAAASEMGKAMAKTGKGGITGKELQGVRQETEEMLASGVAKKGENEMRESATQGVMHDSWKSQKLQEAEAASLRRTTAKSNDEALERQMAEAFEKSKVSIMDEYGNKSLQMKKAAQSLFDPLSGLDEAARAKKTMVTKRLAEMKQRFKMVYSDAGNTTIDGIEKESLDKFTDKEIGNVFKGADEYLGSFRHNSPTLDVVPEDSIKKTVVDTLSAEIKDVASPEDANALRSIISAIEGHGVDDNKVILKAFDDFHASVKISESKNLSKIAESLESYEMMATNGNAAVKGFYQGQRKRIEMMEIINGDGGDLTTWDNDMVKNIIYGMRDLTMATGDLDARYTEKLIDGLHLNSVLRKDPDLGFSELLTPTSKKSFQNFDFINNFDDYLSNERYQTMDSAQRGAKKSMLYAGGMLTGMVRGQGLLESHMYGVMTAQGGVNMLSKASNSRVAKGMKSLVKSGLVATSKAAGVTTGIGSKALNKIDRKAKLSSVPSMMATEEHLRQ